MSEGRYRLHGLKLSYFTGKLEAYLRVKGIPFDYVEIDRAGFRTIGKATGVQQMPALEAPDGSWMTDTTPVIAHFEAASGGPNLTPTDPATAYLSLLLEDYFDEWLWRPALYYRWAFDQDKLLMGRQIADTLLRDMPLPGWLKRAFIIRRQRRVYMAEDGITGQTAPAIEQLYLDMLDQLEPIFASRPFLFGERPCAADFGLFGPFYAHLSRDPTPADIMRARGPNSYAWVGRVWACTPEQAGAAAELTEAPEDLGPILALASTEYLPYLAANEQALHAGADMTHYHQRGVDWSVPTAPYRGQCLAALRAGFAALPETAKQTVAKRLGTGAEILQATAQWQAPEATPQSDKPLDRLWVSAG